MQAHVTRQQLTARAEHCLSDADTITVDEHLEHCERCRERAREIDQTVTRLSSDAADLAHFSCEEGVMKRVYEQRLSGAEEVRLSSGFFSFYEKAWGLTTVRAAAVSAAVVLIVLATGMVFYTTPSRAWTIEQSIAAVQGKRGVHFSGLLAWGGGRVRCEMWIRGREGRSRMEDMLMRVENGAAVWVSGNNTYTYVPPDPVVYTDDAQTAGMTHWPGPEFLELFKRVSRNVEVSSRLDLFSARRLIVLKAQIIGAEGPRSFVMEFDPSSKLLVSLTVWNNLGWAGTPTFEADSIEYLDSAPDDLFAAQVPTNVAYRQKEIGISPENLALLATAGSGRSFSGVSEEEASRDIAEEIIRAEINGDLAKFKLLGPIASLFDDEQLRTVLGGVDGSEALTELVSVGGASHRGRSSLGPLMLVPVVAKQRNGRLSEHKIIVQVRTGTADDFSCVVYGPYGYPYEIE
ncbi:MAG: hypothetical protein EHM61_25165 [Acidobacteria bacterium]|nr:MAG: hypothetical protein EHM61_25165 [Acidobacteriota bacterium]